MELNLKRSYERKTTKDFLAPGIMRITNKLLYHMSINSEYKPATVTPHRRLGLYAIWIGLLLILPGLYHCSDKTPSKTGLEGKSLPSFSILLPDSLTYFNTKNEAPGKPVVLFYFGPYCRYSQAQMREIIKNINGLQGIRFFALTSSQFVDMKKFYTAYNLNRYPNITVGVDYTNFFSSYFKATAVPYMAIYDKNMKLNEVFSGGIYSWKIKEVANE